MEANDGGPAGASVGSSPAGTPDDGPQGRRPAYRSMERDKPYVFYCEVAIKSAHLAEMMRSDGYEAYHWKGGLKSLMKYFEQQDPALKALLSPVLLD